MARDDMSPVIGFEPADRAAILKICRLYEMVAGRSADPEGLGCYASALKDGVPFSQIVRTFLTSPEFQDRRNRRDAAGCLEDLNVTDARSLEQVSHRIAGLIENESVNKEESLLPKLLSGRAAPVDCAEVYRWWLDDFERPIREDSKTLESRLQGLVKRPTFTFIMVLDDTEPHAVERTVSSIRGQIYPHLELLVVITSPNEALHKLIQSQADMDYRIRVLKSWGALRPFWRGDGAGIWDALQKSQGDFVASVRTRDILSNLATLEMADAISRAPESQVVYTDSDWIDSQGLRHSPEFRSDWDMDRLLSGADLGPLVVYSRSLFKTIPKDRRSALAAGFADWQFCLLTTAAISPERILHIPRVLYHQADANGTSGKRDRSRSNFAQVGTHVVKQALSGHPECVVRMCDEERFRVIYPVLQPAPLVSILIPTRDRIELLKSCIEGILHKTCYPAIQIVLLDNNSRQESSRRYLTELASDSRFKLVSYNCEFNWGGMNNLGASVSDGELLLLLNNDVEVLHSDWLSELVGQALRPNVGAVGARLVYPDGTLQHGGLVITPRGSGLHVMRFAPPTYPGYMGSLNTAREVSAVTGACLMIRRQVYMEVGGIEEHELKVGCSDVDLCFKVRARGYKVIWTPYSSLVHKELSTRGPDDTPEKARRAEREEGYIARTWADYLEDPYWSPNLALDESVPPGFAIPPRWKSMDAASCRSRGCMAEDGAGRRDIPAHGGRRNST